MTPAQKEALVLINKKIREDKINEDHKCETIAISRATLNELLSYISSIQDEIAVKAVQSKILF